MSAVCWESFDALLSISGEGMSESFLYDVFYYLNNNNLKLFLRTRQLYTLVIMNDFMLTLLV